jgi:uncharacterized membrane protein SpoIIM required for sporulation
MKQNQFESQYRGEWLEFEALLQILADNKKDQRHDTQFASFPERYRRLCHQHALAHERGYSLPLIQQLNELIFQGHRQLYRHRLPIVGPLIRFILHDFPVAVREQKIWNLASGFFFVFAVVFMWVLVDLQPEMIYSLIDGANVTNIEDMYEPGAGFREDRDSSDDVTMFGYYIYNNIGIAFRTFASGLFFGIGAIVVELFNGAYFGAIAAHLINIGSHEPFFTFVVAHGAPELTAIALSGGSGMRLGWALIAPGPWPRRYALQRAAQLAMPVMYGAFGLLLIAAFVEAFWSPRQFEPTIKYSVGAASWALLYLYLLVAGRRNA